jgi:AcrR family transcriptional regulator
VTASANARDRLIDAAERRFGRYGYRRTSVADITDEASTGKGSLYLHFPSKSDLYLAVVERRVSAFVDCAVAAMGGARPAPARLASLVAATAEHYRRDEFLAASLLGDADLVAGEAAELAADLQRGRIQGLIAGVLRDGQAEGSIRADLDPATAAEVLFEIGWAVVRRHLERRSGRGLDADLATLNDLVAHGTLARR